RRAPDASFGVVRPNHFAGVRIETVEFAIKIGGEEQIVGDGHCGNRSADLRVRPDDARRTVSAGFSRIDAGQTARAFPLLGILPDGDVHAILVYHRRGDDLAGAVGRAILRLALLGRIHIAAPKLLEVLVKSAAKAVAGA